MAVDLKPTEAMANAASRALEWRREYERGMTPTGVARARDISNRTNLSPETIGRMVSFFARHGVNREEHYDRKEADGGPTAWRIAWDGWGGDPGRAWANRKSDELDNEAADMGRKSNWYAIQSTEDGSAEISLFDEIGFGGTSAKEFIAELKKLSGQHIHLRVNSVGGSVVEGTAIYNALRRHKGGLTVHIEALAASMASVVAMAGEEVAIADNALVMIHNPWSMSMGDADDLRKEADILDKLKNTLVNAYKRKTGMDAEEIANLMDEETWLGAEEAVAMGFADYIEDGMEAAASITPEQAHARFDKFSNSMARKTAKTIKAEEAAPEVAETAAEPVVEAAPEAPVVDNESKDMTAELQAKVDALQAELFAKVDAEAAQAQASEDIAKEIETLKAEVERLTAESASKDEQINELLAQSKSAGEQAAAIVASVGIDPVAVVAPAEELTAAQIFNSLSGAEAVEYFRKNKREIIASVY